MYCIYQNSINIYSKIPFVRFMDCDVIKYDKKKLIEAVLLPKKPTIVRSSSKEKEKFHILQNVFTERPTNTKRLCGEGERTV